MLKYVNVLQSPSPPSWRCRGYRRACGEKLGLLQALPPTPLGALRHPGEVDVMLLHEPQRWEELGGRV